MSRRQVAVWGLGAAALVCALAGCGKLGELDRPGPLFGPNAGQPAGQVPDAAGPVTVDPRDRNVDPLPPSAAPAAGQAVPSDTYANPK
jgi:hypothetical protein